MNMTVKMHATAPAVLRFAIQVAVEVDMVSPSEARVGRCTPKVSSLANSGPTSVAGMENMSNVCHFHSKCRVSLGILMVMSE